VKEKKPIFYLPFIVYVYGVFQVFILVYSLHCFPSWLVFGFHLLSLVVDMYDEFVE
jgi:hypothetical protein